MIDAAMPDEPIAEITSGRLRLGVVRHGDGYTHHLASDSARLDAVEHPRFDTPVFTDLHRQGDTLFLSGMSGGRHWSASIEPCEGGFLFDVACRLKIAYRPAASAYRGEGLRIVNAGEGVSAAVVKNDGEARLALPAEEVEPMPATLRWRYRVSAWGQKSIDRAGVSSTTAGSGFDAGWGGSWGFEAASASAILVVASLAGPDTPSLCSSRHGSLAR